MAKDYDEQLAKLKAKREQLDARMSKLAQKAKNETRKRDARRKIVIGGAILAYMEKDESCAPGSRRCSDARTGAGIGLIHAPRRPHTPAKAGGGGVDKSARTKATGRNIERALRALFFVCEGSALALPGYLNKVIAPCPLSRSTNSLYAESARR